MFFGLFFFLIILFLFIPSDRTYYVRQDSCQKPMDILNERFVNGEIDEEEYITKKKILLGK